MEIVLLSIVLLVFVFSAEFFVETGRHENVPSVDYVVGLDFFERRGVSESVQQLIGVGLFVMSDVFWSDVSVDESF